MTLTVILPKFTDEFRSVNTIICLLSAILLFLVCSFDGRFVRLNQTKVTVYNIFIICRQHLIFYQL